MQKNYFLPLAILLLSLPLHAQFSTPAPALEKHVATLASDSLLGRGFGTEQGMKAARYIAEQLENAGVEPLNGSYLFPFNHRKGILNIAGINVAGVIPGSDPQLKEEYILLGAHFDHLGWKVSNGDTVVYNGADDNASGTASVIEIGRNLAARKESLGRSVILAAFDGEESGLIGSTRFLEDSVVPPDKLKLMFSLDMVGMYEAHGGLDLAGVNLLNDPQEITGRLAGEYNIAIRKTNGKIEQRTDTAPFGKIGVPAIHAFTGTESPYHKPEDVAGELDYEGMALVTSFLSAATLQLSSTQDLSAMKGPAEGQDELFQTRIFRPGIRLNMGSSRQNYRDQFYKGKSILSAEAGLFATIRLNSFLTLQPEVLYGTGGSQHPDGSFRTHSITAPLNLMLTSSEEEMVRTWLMAGAYYSYHFGGKVGDGSIDFQDVYENQELGISYGFGMEVMNVQLGFIFRRGLTGSMQDPATDKVTSEGFAVSLGFIF